jgi:hypothetical protein
MNISKTHTEVINIRLHVTQIDKTKNEKKKSSIFKLILDTLTYACLLDFNEFLIDGENCKIPNLNPFSKEAFIDFNRQQYTKCSERKPLTRVEHTAGGSDLIIDASAKDEYTSWWQNDIKVCIL